jgi:hypothetical protein
MCDSPRDDGLPGRDQDFAVEQDVHCGYNGDDSDLELI